MLSCLVLLPCLVVALPDLRPRPTHRKFRPSQSMTCISRSASRDPPIARSDQFIQRLLYHEHLAATHPSQDPRIIILQIFFRVVSLETRSGQPKWFRLVHQSVQMASVEPSSTTLSVFFYCVERSSTTQSFCFVCVEASSTTRSVFFLCRSLVE